MNRIATVVTSLFGICALHACSGGVDTATSPGPTGCPAPFVDCDGACIDAQLDPAHCGACGVACPEGELCSVGQCGTECLGGTVKCGDRCVDSQLDAAHCGGCNQACGDGEVCSQGQCGIACLGGTTKCGTVCVDTTFDSGHCGACDNACPEGQVCSGGGCGVECLGGTTKCGDGCVDVDVDPAHCGGCNLACGVGEVCSQGQCALECLGGTTKCGTSCVDTSIDANHCGVCNLQCGFDEVCSGGTCALDCVGGATKCGNECVDTTNDPAHCGACNNACGQNEVCSNDQCGLACLGGTTKCGSKCVDTGVDPAHCGGCNNACQPGEVCSGGACALECVGGSTKCGQSCVDTQSSTAHCGGCGNACPMGQVCVKGACQGTTCTPGAQELCYDGPQSTLAVGKCKPGTKTCNATGTGYGPCTGQVLPDANETCGDSVDDDCDGQAFNGCVLGTCKDWKTADPNAADGVYTIDHGQGVNGQRQVYCDMTFEQGGWLAVFNMMERPGNNAEAAKMHASLIQNANMSAPVMPTDTSTAIHTADIPLGGYTEVIYGWAKSSSADVTRWGHYTKASGLVGACHLDGFCGDGVAVATMDIHPTNTSRTIYTGNQPTYPHVGLGFSGQIIVWGYDNNQSANGHWGNWYDLNPCCNAGNNAEIATPGWRYVIYIR